MGNTQVLNNQKNCDMIGLKSPQQSTDAQIVVMQTNDKQLAKHMADHYLALAQAYRQMAGMEPIRTGAHQRKVARECNR